MRYLNMPINSHSMTAKLCIDFGENDLKLEEKMRVFCDEAFSDCPHTGNKGLYESAIHTPYSLCADIIGKLPDLNGKTILVWFNPEFYYIIRERYKQAKVVLITGSKNASAMFDGKHQYIRTIYCRPDDFDSVNKLLRREVMKFDVVIGNPPYQASYGRSASHKQLWPDFVKKSLELVKDNGHVALIHPSPWRKPDYKPLPFEIFKALNLKYLEVHSTKDGQKVFGATTRYDWYILQLAKNSGKTTIKDESGVERVVNLQYWDYLPNKELEMFASLLANKGEEMCNVIYSRSAYGTDKEHISKINNEIFKYPCVHSIPKLSNMQIDYSKHNENGHFGIHKVIINKTGSMCCVNDFEGKYGMTEWVFGIEISSKEEGKNIICALNSDKFGRIWEATQWLAMTREWKIFRSFRKDFWREFV